MDSRRTPNQALHLTLPCILDGTASWEGAVRGSLIIRSAAEEGARRSMCRLFTRSRRVLPLPLNGSPGSRPATSVVRNN
ncbi:unnamed protein product [Tuwongella immobilis]|uniref:Uncharacterized protein n=1 Tax=Tuwongella immobilis TaxID=692036 RepID=A0A6C2YK24_9BACT|nr:unnamed protein product [Tuwongella immobilis]VTR99415.1 unnamed protein product [Tuwongella immobilis]